MKCLICRGLRGMDESNVNDGRHDDADTLAENQSLKDKLSGFVGANCIRDISGRERDRKSLPQIGQPRDGRLLFLFFVREKLFVLFLKPFLIRLGSENLHEALHVVVTIAAKLTADDFHGVGGHDGKFGNARGDEF